jgi:hypothetical protein
MSLEQQKMRSLEQEILMKNQMMEKREKLIKQEKIDEKKQSEKKEIEKKPDAAKASSYNNRAEMSDEVRRKVQFYENINKILYTF